MSANFAKPTYEELINTLKDKELQIDHLLKNESSLTNLNFYFKESLDFVGILGADGFYKEVNPAFIKMLGYTKEELLSKSSMCFVHPDDVESSTKEMERLSVATISIIYENRHIKKWRNCFYTVGNNY